MFETALLLLACSCLLLCNTLRAWHCVTCHALACWRAVEGGREPGKVPMLVQRRLGCKPHCLKAAEGGRTPRGLSAGPESWSMPWPASDRFVVLTVARRSLATTPGRDLSLQSPTRAVSPPTEAPRLQHSNSKLRSRSSAGTRGRAAAGAERAPPTAAAAFARCRCRPPARRRRRWWSPPQGCTAPSATACAPRLRRQAAGGLLRARRAAFERRMAVRAAALHYGQHAHAHACNTGTPPTSAAAAATS